MPLHLRYKQLILNYWSNLQGHKEEEHPTVRALRPCWESEKDKTECYVWTANKMAKKMRLHEKIYSATAPYLVTPTWLFPTVTFDFHIQEKVKIDKRKENWAGIVEERLRITHNTLVPIYTDW